MKTETKSKIKKSGAVGLGMGGAAFLGFANATGIDHIFADKIIESIKEGDITKLAAYGFVFLAIWLQVRKLTTEVASLNSNINSPEGIIAKSFAKGEVRFEAIEKTQADFQHIQNERWKEFDLFKQTHGGTLHERTSII